MKYFSICLTIILFFFLLSFILWHYNIICTNFELKSTVIPNLCNNTLSEDILLPNVILDPNLCKFLCSHKLEIACHSYHLNKKYVFDVYEKGDTTNKFVVKSTVKLEYYEGGPQSYWEEEDSSMIVPKIEELEEMLLSHVNLFLGTTSRKPIKSVLNMISLSHVNNPAFHKYLWKFISDHEFLMGYLFSNYLLFPKVLGTCENFYAVEYAEPLIKNPLLPIEMPWAVRLTKAIAILKLIKKFGTIWDEEIHLCDMKHDHFGFNDIGEVLFLDLDCVETNSSLTNIMSSTPSCLNDDDCSYFDCHGKCLPSNRCSAIRQNSNLQVLCSKIFLGHSNSFLPLFGLLDRYDASDNLKHMLEECVYNRKITIDSLLEVLKSEYKLYTSKKDEL